MRSQISEQKESRPAFEVRMRNKPEMAMFRVFPAVQTQVAFEKTFEKLHTENEPNNLGKKKHKIKKKMKH